MNTLLRKAPVHCYTEISLIISEQIIEPEEKANWSVDHSGEEKKQTGRKCLDLNYLVII